MSDFEDNNPFSGSGRRLSSSSGLTSDFAPLSIENQRGLGPNATSASLSRNSSVNGANSSAILEDNNPFGGDDLAANGGFAASSNNEYGSNDDNTNFSYNNDTASGTPRVYSSRIEHILYTEPDATITIVDAGKSHEGSSRGFISYTIKINDVTVRRRYSEFESLRITLTKLFPTLIIPPIPEKHSMCKLRFLEIF